jgi:hypothetical protein
MGATDRTPIDFESSAPLIFEDFRRHLQSAIEEEGWVVGAMREPPERRGVGWAGPWVFLTLTVIGTVNDVTDLSGKAKRAVDRVAAVVRGRRKRQMNTVIKCLYGPSGEELARVEVPASGPNGEDDDG